MTIRAYPMAARQASFVTDRGDEVTMRPMMKTDKDALLDFLRRVPEEDRFYLKDDVTSHRWLASGPPTWNIAGHFPSWLLTVTR